MAQARMLSVVINPHRQVHLSETKVMTRVKKFSMIAIALATLGTSMTGASAETLWQYNHPRRAEVNERLGYQNYRIHDGVEDGRISPWRAARLHAELSKLPVRIDLLLETPRGAAALATHQRSCARSAR